MRVEWSRWRRWKPIWSRAQAVSVKRARVAMPAPRASGEHPVPDAGGAPVEVHAAQRDPAEYSAVVARDRPVAALLLFPVLAVAVEPFPDASLG